MSEVKTLAIRLDAELHSRLTILAKLTGISITDAIRTAIEKEVDAMADNPDVAARASDYQAAIVREAEEQSAAIQALFGTPKKPGSTRSTGRK